MDACVIFAADTLAGTMLLPRRRETRVRT